ncbi:MAG TPA: CDP-alcohol phosphatidyltransferase family protein [Kofleriaceae bacterium]|nr:CDP-alcohol phosphatidyltransferase family protein [Kofleriaceae bacterium]
MPTSATFAERYRRMRSRWNEDWWSITLGGPLGNVLNGLIADLPWVKPNRITWLSFLCLLASGPLLLLGSRGADVAAVVLLQLHTILDCMDGSLARYRKASSVMGAFLDKVTDMIGLLVVMACFGWRVWVDTGDAFALLVATLIAGSIVLRGYVFWVVASLERERKVQKPTVGDRRRDCSTMSFGERAALYVRSQWKIVEFAESDLYFWLGLGVALGRMRQTVYFLGVATGFWAAVILGWRYWTVRKLEAAR